VPGLKAQWFACCLACAALFGCASEAVVEGETQLDKSPWRVHCETEQSYLPDLKAIPGVYHGNWIWAESEAGELVYLRGEIEGGYFILESAVTESGKELPAAKPALRELCEETIARDSPGDLARVLAARDSRDLAVVIIYPGESAAPGKVSRLVVFGDSLSDTGRLKHRMQVFPGPPYWLGRFSNGPTWPEYLEQATSLAVQNRSYGGASVNPPHDLDEAGLVGFVKDEGRFFVSGSIADQVTSYLESQRSKPQLDSPDKTAYLIWAGANDYISKEPITGLITTFLNSSRGELGYKTVAEETVTAQLQLIRRLYQSGGRRFLMGNMPNLGLTPIVLQNDSYKSGLGIGSDNGRRVELSRRLTRLSEYHNEILLRHLEQLRIELTGAEILLVDTFSMTENILSRRLYSDPSQAFDYGFALDALSQELVYQDQGVVLQGNCYSGAYLGSFSDNDTCDVADTAFFWDVIHPSTFAHCWQAYLVGDTLAAQGWIEQLPGPDLYRNWCQDRKYWQ
jgi:phospholipase/lecithinase/hemolysin